MKTPQFSPQRNVVGELSSTGTRETRIEPPRLYSGPGAFTKLLSDSIGEVLTDLLGTRAREAVFDYMERNYSIARHEIPEHLNQFFMLFERNFGTKSKSVIGRAIAKKVHLKLDWQFEPVPNFEFADYIENIRTRIARETFNPARQKATSKV